MDGDGIEEQCIPVSLLLRVFALKVGQYIMNVTAAAEYFRNL